MNIQPGTYVVEYTGIIINGQKEYEIISGEYKGRRLYVNADVPVNTRRVGDGNTRGIHHMLIETKVHNRHIEGAAKNFPFAQRVYRMIDKEGWCEQRMNERKRCQIGHAIMVDWHTSRLFGL